MAKKGEAKVKEEVKEPKIMFYTWKATGELDKKGKPIFERVPVYEKPKPDKTGMLKWVLKKGKTLKEYNAKLAELNKKDKAYYAKKKAIDAEFYEKIVASDNSKYSTKKPEFYIKWIDGKRMKCDVKTGEPFEEFKK